VLSISGNSFKTVIGKPFQVIDLIQSHDRYESDAVRDRLTVFPMASALKS